MDTATELELPDAPPIPGLRFRRFRDPSDYGLIAQLQRTANLHDGEDWAPDAETFRVEFEHAPDVVPERDIVLAEVDGTAVAWASHDRRIRGRVAVYGTEGAVDPAWRRRGIGRALLRHNELEIRALAARFDDPVGRTFGAWAGEKQVGANALVLSEGYAAVRWYFSMRRPNLDEVPDAPLPDGLEIRPVRPEDHRAIFDADNEAFRDHWGHVEHTDEDFAGLHAQPDVDPGLWSVAWDGDQVAGSVQTVIWKSENETLGVRRGWLEHISVRRPWRRRGVARALIADSLRRLAAAGMNEAMLGVDADNPTGALELYESIGFAVKDRATAYRKAIDPGGRLV